MPLELKTAAGALPFNGAPVTDGKQNAAPQKENIKSKIYNLAAGAAGGAVYYGITKAEKKYIRPFLAEKAISLGKLTQDEMTAVKDASKNICSYTGLDKFGVKILGPNDKEKFMSALKNNPFINFLYKKFSKDPVKGLKLESKITQSVNNIFTKIKSGSNAAYHPMANMILMPETGDLDLALFHEAGHALNNNMSKFGKILQYSGKTLPKIAVPAVLLASLFKNDKKDVRKPEGIIDKTLSFIKNNAGKLAFLSFIPQLIEEGTASLRGYKTVKGMVSPELVSKYSKFAGAAFMTYLANAAITSAAVWSAVKVKDYITKKIPDKTAPV